MNPRLLISFFVITMLIFSVSSIGFADSTYQLSMSGTVDIPTQNVTIDGTEHSFSSVGKVAPDGTISVDASGPDGAILTIYLYNNDEQIEDSERVNGSAQVTFDAGPLSDGTYLVALEGEDGQIKEIQPVIVKGYSVTISTPDKATAGESFTVNVSVSQLDSGSESVSAVTLAVAQGDDYQEITASKIAPDTYQATVTIDETGSYGIYAGARGQEDIDGEKQLVGISDRKTVTVESKRTETPSPTPSTAEDNSNPDSNSASETASSTSTETPTESSTGTTQSTTVQSPTITESPNPTETETPGSVVTPVTSDPSPGTATTTVTTPLNAIQWLILLLFVAATTRKVQRW